VVVPQRPPPRHLVTNRSKSYHSKLKKAVQKRQRIMAAAQPTPGMQASEKEYRTMGRSPAGDVEGRGLSVAEVEGTCGKQSSTERRKVEQSEQPDRLGVASA
jgi:hypothetical protein